MRIQRYGFTTPTSNVLVPGPQPFRGFGGEWEDWCDINYFTPEHNTKCKKCTPLPFGPCLFPHPKTVVGRQVRGLPAQTDLELQGQPEVEEPMPDDVPSGGGGAPGSFFEKNKMLLIAGGGVLAIGLAFAFSRGGKRGFRGYSSKKRRTKRRRN